MKSLPLPTAQWLRPNTGRHTFSSRSCAIRFSSGSYVLTVWADTGKVLSPSEANPANWKPGYIDQGLEAVRLAEKFIRRVGPFGSYVRETFGRIMVWRYR